MRLRPLIFAGLLSTSAFAKNILDLSAARNMPAWFLCPACAATVYQTIQQLMAAETKAGERSGQLLSDDDAIAALEHTCESEVWDLQYGTQSFGDSRLALAGPGLPRQTHEAPMQPGGRWSAQLRKMCAMYVEEGEDFYHAHWRGVLRGGSVAHGSFPHFEGFFRSACAQSCSELMTAAILGYWRQAVDPKKIKAIRKVKTTKMKRQKKTKGGKKKAAPREFKIGAIQPDEKDEL